METPDIPRLAGFAAWLVAGIRDGFTTIGEKIDSLFEVPNHGLGEAFPVRCRAAGSLDLQLVAGVK